MTYNKIGMRRRVSQSYREFSLDSDLVRIMLACVAMTRSKGKKIRIDIIRVLEIMYEGLVNNGKNEK